jgi:eukaryotic-like serine/threonine-protein kinase
MFELPPSVQEVQLPPGRSKTKAHNHPNILTIHDIGTARPEFGGVPYIATELLKRAELREQLNEGALPVRRYVEYAQQIAAGLAAAHKKDIVHCDLEATRGGAN